VLARIKTRQQARSLPPDEVAALAADLLRVGQFDEAVNRLKPLYDDRGRKGTRTYAVCAALVHAHAARGEWDQALNYLPDLFDAPVPAEVKGVTPAQRDWQAKLDRDYLPHYLHLRKAEAARRPVPETEEPTPLFPLPAREHPTDPVRFVNDAGQYEPGKLAASERAKLPPDAVAVVQQFLLWFPTDTRLYWLLGELYAADGQLDEAWKVLEECAWSKQYGNRKVMMDHRTAVAGAIAARDQAAEQAREAAMPISLRTVLIYFGVVAAVGVLAVIRALARRGGNCNPGG
jgi:tetratricopeptide (TPR) repeat protein